MVFPDLGGPITANLMGSEAGGASSWRNFMGFFMKVLRVALEAKKYM